MSYYQRKVRVTLTVPQADAVQQALEMVMLNPTFMAIDSPDVLARALKVVTNSVARTAASNELKRQQSERRDRESGDYLIAGKPDGQ